MNQNERNVEAVKRLQQFVETISATFRLMTAEIDRLLQDLAQPLHEIARAEEDQRMASWAHLDERPLRALRKSVEAKRKKKHRRRKITGKR